MCQKPPSPMTEIERLSAATLNAEAEAGPEAIAHRRRADIERRQDREQMAADIGGDVMRAELLLDQLHRGEDRPLRTAGAEARRARRHDFAQRLDLGIGEHRRRIGQRRLVAEQRRAHAARGIRGCPSTITGAVYSPAIGSTSLPAILRLDIAPAQDRVERLLDIFGLALLDHQHGALARAERDDLVVDQRIGDVHAHRAARAQSP